MTKSDLIKTGITFTGLGLFMLTWGLLSDDDGPTYFDQPETDNSILDAEWYDIE